MSNQPVIDALKTLLADSYTLYLKTQNYHWNVTGPHFKPLHELFMEQYTDLSTAVDDIAERIRTLGEKAPGSYREFATLATLKEATGKETAPEMVEALSADQKALVKTLYRLLKAAQTAEDEGTIALATERIPVHEKNAWMLAASL